MTELLWELERKKSGNIFKLLKLRKNKHFECSVTCRISPKSCTISKNCCPVIFIEIGLGTRLARRCLSCFDLFVLVGRWLGVRANRAWFSLRSLFLSMTCTGRSPDLPPLLQSWVPILWLGSPYHGKAWSDLTDDIANVEAPDVFAKIANISDGGLVSQCDFADLAGRRFSVFDLLILPWWRAQTS